MSHTGRQSVNSSNVLSVIMGGGQGKRLFPLTKERAKPAVPLAGKYRLVDIPISNCINSGLRRIYLLTQFNSASLHRHIAQSYKFDHFSGGFVEILAAEQSFSDTSWYQGTADAVRKNMIHFLNHDWDYLLILSGDQLYRMDFRPIIQLHSDKGADITIATIPVARDAAQSLGIMQIDTEQRITRFVEKPKDPAVLDSLKLPPEWYPKLDIKGDGDLFLASMGIYVFNRDVIRRLLDNTLTDFGKHIIPQAIKDLRVFSFVFQGYWEYIVEHEKAGKPRIGIGENCRIENTIVDKNARIGNNVVITPAGKPDNVDHANYYIRDGIVIIPKNGVLPHGMVI